MSKDHQPVPKVEHVVTTVGRLINASWPTTDDERIALFDEVDLTPGTPFGADPQAGTDLEGWGNTVLMWSTHSDEFVGITLFLWTRDKRKVIKRLAEHLVSALADRLGPPLERWGEEPQAALWRTDTHTIELYPWARRARSVQLSIAHTSRLAAHELDLEGLDEDDDQ